MMISNCDPNPTTSDDPLQISKRELNNEEWNSLKQCHLKDNEKTDDLINLNQFDRSLIVLKDY